MRSVPPQTTIAAPPPGFQRCRKRRWYGADVLWDASNWSPRFDDQIEGSFPPALPGSGWPVLLRRAYWQLLNFVINTLG